METAHPSKFKEDMERVLQAEIDVPERLARLKDREKKADFLKPMYDSFHDWLMERLV